MKMIKFSIPIALFAVCLFMTSCQKDDPDGEEYTFNYYDPEDYAMMSQYLNIPENPSDLSYTLDFPLYYTTPSTVYDKDLATLGRVLFYDKNLSKDKTISCGSCHKQEIAFSDDVAFSEGIEGRSTARNSLALGSVFSFSEYYGAESFGRIPFFWDNRASTVAEQAIATFGNEQEMGMEMHEVVSRVNEQPYYGPLFAAAFGRSTEVTEDNVLEAITEFVNSMGSFDSKFDQALSHETGGPVSNAATYATQDFSQFSVTENLGKALYQRDCASCHSPVISAPSRTRSNNGLAEVYEDKGIGEISSGPENVAMFKVPTLRNIALTAPYMHDGSFPTLESVIEHYSSGIKDHDNLDNGLQPGGFGYTQAEKDALLAFLNTTTDEGYIAAEKYSDPFKQ